MTNAKFYRNLICAGLGALALGYVPLSHAFYAQATPPLGFTAGAVNTYNAARAGVEASVALGRISANAALSVGGRSVAIATRIPLASTAAQVAARVLFANPYLLAAGALALWVSSKNFSYDPASGWTQPDPQNKPQVSDGNYWNASETAGYYPMRLTAYDVCMLDVGPGYSGWKGTCEKIGETSSTITFKLDLGSWSLNAVARKHGPSTCPNGWYVTTAGCVQKAPGMPVLVEDFVRELGASPLPDAVPQHIPAGLPVDVPWFDPIFIPTGAPVKNPAYDPTKPQTGDNQPYVQPGVKVDPANDAKNPFQVNLQPTNRPTASPTGSADPQPITPPGTEGDGSTDKPKEDKDERDLCEKNPDILACQKVDTEVEDAEIPKAQKTVSYMPENPFGGGACPADKYARVGGQELKVVDWTRDCQFVRDYVTPVAFVLTTLIVGAILLGGLKP